jgi:hypothetical protein
MKSNASRRMSFLSVITGLLVATVAAAPSARAQEIEKAGCDDRSLRGDYGFTIDGTVFAGPSPFMVKGVALTHFDGHGNLSQVDFTTRNGVPAGPDWRPATGTYSIDANCTGSAVINPEDGSPSLNLRLVVIDRGRQVLTTVAGNSTNSIGTKVH